MKAYAAWAAAAVGLMCLSGCGYTTHASLPSRYQTIYVAPVQNKIDFASLRQRNIYLPLLEVEAHTTIVDQFQRDGRLRIGEPTTADLIATTDLIGYTRTPLRFTDNEDVEEYRVELIAAVTVKDAQTGEVLWQEASLAGRGEYFLTNGPITSEEAAVREAVRDLARRIVERTIEYW